MDGATKHAASGGRFVVVATTVQNRTKESMDLTCSLPIQTEVYDDEGAQYDEIEDLYQIAGNPECNAELQPGFSHAMTYIYLVPTSANIVSMSVQNTEEIGNQGPITTGSISSPGH